MYWAIDAVIHTVTADGWNTYRHLPTFYLNANVQGILTAEQAVRIAHDIVDPFQNPDWDVDIMATAI
jgi:hypothetical protein